MIVILFVDFVLKHILNLQLKKKRDFLIKITKGDYFDKKISNSIMDLYQTLLSRSPDPEGFNFLLPTNY